MNQSVITRFWKYVDKRGKKSCWDWNGSTMLRGGYGQLNDRGKLLKAHRISFEIHKGLIPKGKHVLHKCDRAICCNPAHLYLGSNLENTQDRVKAGTQFSIPAMRGDKNPGAKLSLKQVKIVLSSKISGAELGRRFGVTRQSIFRIRKGLTWKIAQQ